MKATVSVFTLGFFAAILAGGCSLLSSAEDGGNRLSLALTSDRETYSLGDPVQVTLTLRNSADESQLVNARMAANQPAAPASVREIVFEITDPYGQIAPLGARINVRMPRETDFQILGPGQAVSRTYDLASLYAFDEPGTYSVRAVYQNSQDPPSGGDAWKGEIESNTVVLTFE